MADRQMRRVSFWCDLEDKRWLEARSSGSSLSQSQLMRVALARLRRDVAAGRVEVRREAVVEVGSVGPAED